MRRIRVWGLLVLLFSGLALSARAATITPTIKGNELTGRIELPGGVAADLTITFEQAVGLNAGSLSITANLINPLDAHAPRTAALGRFDSGGLPGALWRSSRRPGAH